MKIEQVGAQLYTIREHIKEPAQVAQSMRRLREIGYQAVQVSGMGAIDEAELVKICDGEGLTICATHESTAMILDEPQRVVERLQKLNCRYTAVPSPGGLDASSEESVLAYAGRMDKAGAVLRAAGQTLMYHNHGNEFVRVGGKTILDHFYDATQPENLAGEIDTYWVQYGGGDPVAWCAKLKGRLPVIHLKDYQFLSENKPGFAEIGRGNLNIPAIIATAEESGCEWFVVEQDTTPGDPFDSLQISFEYLSGLTS
jgi:sugar phosphate isomerase/epimerase